jgi:hypothetical protein
MKKGIVFGVLALLLVSGLTGCMSLSGGIFGSGSSDSGQGEAKEVVYKEIPYSELAQAISSVNSPGNGFIVEAYFIDTDAPGEGSYRISETQKGTPSQWFDAHDGGDDDAHYHSYLEPHQFETYNAQTYRRIDKTKKYKIYLGLYQNSYSTKDWDVYIDKIEGLRTMEEVAAIEAQEKAEQTAANEAKKRVDVEAKESKQNPNGLDRSKYKEITVEDFSFDMVAGKLSIGSKFCFQAKFFTKPTGTNYRFDDVNMALTLSSDHNFVRDIPERCFAAGQGLFGWENQRSVKIFVTVTKTGQTGTCSVDIVEW